MSRISLIVPVYNVEGYLDACLESLVGQTLSDLEVICVNDGSTDASRQILERWQRRDGRVVVIDKPNGGPSSARNAGIEVARSDYICFPDADDLMSAETCETIVSVMEGLGADVMTFGAECMPPDGAPGWVRESLSPRDVVYDGFSPDILFKENSRPFAWRTACRASLLRESAIRFEEGLSLGEDQAFQFALYPRSKRTVLSSKRLYTYRVNRAGSIMRATEDDFATKMLRHADVVDCILRDWERGGYLRQYAPEMLAFVMDFALYDAIKLADDSYRAVADKLREVLSRYWSVEDIKAMPLAPVVKRMALAACYGGRMGTLARKRLVLEYYTHQHGLRAVLHKALRQSTLP